MLALVFSQWLVVAHAATHPALTIDLSCQICLHAPGLDDGLPAAKTAAPPPALHGEAPASRPAPALPHRRPAHPRIRGPPAALA